MKDNDELPRFAIDVVSLALLLGVLADALPVVASVLTIVWTFIRICETETVKRVWRWWCGPRV